jgi:arylsulfatase A-like enzyme
LMNSVDIMPTLLGLMGAPIPEGVQGVDLSAFPLGKKAKEPESVFLQDILPCGQAVDTGITEWRGVRTRRYTYARHRDKGWVLYDNQADPYQKNNLIDKPEAKDTQATLEKELQGWLARTKDDFASRETWCKRVGIPPEATKVRQPAAVD